MSYDIRPSLDELLSMKPDDVRAWWPYMSRRDRNRWIEAGDHAMLRRTSVLLAEKIPIDDSVPFDEEETATASIAIRSDVRRWLSRLKKLAKNMPEDLFIAVSRGSLAVYVNSLNDEKEIEEDKCLLHLRGRYYSL